MGRVEEQFFVPSERLKDLRQFAAAYRSLAPYIGAAVQFRVVIDTNMILKDIRWLIHKRINPSARPSLLETIDAGTLEAYVPYELLAEVDEHIPRIALEEGIDGDAMMSVWASYKTKLKVEEADIELVRRYEGGIDPDDAAFLALAQSVKAAAIVSEDRHIRLMGGRQVGVEFVLALREYSRAVAVELSIRVMGVSIAFTTVAAIRGVIRGICKLVDTLRSVPPWVKIALIAGFAVCAFHRPTRTAIVSGVTELMRTLSEVAPEIMAVVKAAIVHAESQKMLATGALERAQAELI